MKFLIIGDGQQAKKHKQAIANIGGDLIGVYDTEKYGHTPRDLPRYLNGTDWVSICSPSKFHLPQIKKILNESNVDIICEKPVAMPWENPIDDDRVNIVLQYRYLDDMPEKANKVTVVMARNAEYFKSYKGNIEDTGGIFYHLFIHYIDLSIRLNAEFCGEIIPDGTQIRMVDDFDILNIDMDKLYTKMYDEIVFKNNGVKTKDIQYLLWVMKKLDILHTFESSYKKIKMNEWVKYAV